MYQLEFFLFSYHNTYRAPVQKAFVPVVKTAAVVHSAPIVAHPVVHHAAPIVPLVRTAPVVAHPIVSAPAVIVHH